MRQIDDFEIRIDKIIEEGVTKAQLLDAFHKSNPNSLNSLPENVTKLPELTSTIKYV